MRSGLLMILLAALLGLGAYGGYYSWQRPIAEPASMNELEWLRLEFNLDEERFSKVQEIHATYQPICDYLCARVIEAQERLEKAIVESDTFTPELEEELANFSRLKERCHRAMLKHVYEVAAVMGPEDRERYIQKAKAQVIIHDRVH